MARLRILNPDPAPAELEAVALSREVLAEAKAVADPGQCARLDALAGQLHGVAPERIAGDAGRIAFWANLYNALVLHCLCLRPLRGNLLWHLRLFDRIAYRVGGRDYPLNLIENGVLRANRRPPYRLRPPLRLCDPRLRAAPSALDPRIHFALNCGARSCPPIRDYDPDSLDEQLELATRTYMAAEAAVDPGRQSVQLPRLMRLYRADFGDRDQQLEFAARYLPELRDWIDDEAGQVRLGYGRFDWTVARPVSP
jgi:hypothetical protein